MLITIKNGIGMVRGPVSSFLKDIFFVREDLFNIEDLSNDSQPSQWHPKLYTKGESHPTLVTFLLILIGWHIVNFLTDDSILVV